MINEIKNWFKTKRASKVPRLETSQTEDAPGGVHVERSPGNKRVASGGGQPTQAGGSSTHMGETSTLMNSHMN